MLTQKLYRNGNSVAVTIPKEYLEKLRLSDSSEVMVTLKGEDLIVSKINKKLAPNVDDKFMKMVDEFVNEHKDVLKVLANK